jgi:mono/diheme cytochrome c family protein
MIAFPAIGNRDFLELVSDDFLRENILQGRPGRRMPAWGESAGGLRDEEIDSIVHHLRQLGGGVEPKPDPRPKRWAEGDPARGRALYAATCASCHGDTGEGKEGPALANRVFLETAGDTYIVKTILGGRDGTEMPAFSRPSLTRRTLSNREAEAITAYIRTWEERE